MSRKQVAFLILINAAISALISIGVVVVLVLPALEDRPTVLATPPSSPSPEETTVANGPSPEPVIHVVQTGDTISGLAFQYDVPENEIIAANNLENPNYLRVGMELIIPVGGMPQVTPTLTPRPTVTDTPIPFEPPSADMTATAAAEVGATATSLPTPLPSQGELRIEITEVLHPGDLAQEAVLLTNVGEQLADMAGWTLRDAEGNAYVFPNFRLWAEGNATVHTRAGQDGYPPSNFYWGSAVAVWSPGETVTLLDASGQEVAAYVVGQ